MAASNPFNLDVRGMLDVQAQLALVSLPPKLRIRLLNRLGKRVRTQWRDRVRQQRDASGAAFEPRKRKRKKGQPAKMLGNLPKYLNVTKATPDHVEVGYHPGQNSIIASAHNEGANIRMSAAQLRRQRKDTSGNATRYQARRLRRLGLKIRQPSKTKSNGKRGKARWLKPGAAWIQENVGYDQAGLLIKVLANHQAGPTSWEIPLPKRQFFGITNQRDISELVAHLLPQILNSPR